MNLDERWFWAGVITGLIVIAICTAWLATKHRWGLTHTVNGVEVCRETWDALQKKKADEVRRRIDQEFDAVFQQAVTSDVKNVGELEPYFAKRSEAVTRHYRYTVRGASSNYAVRPIECLKGGHEPLEIPEADDYNILSVKGVGRVKVCRYCRLLYWIPGEAVVTSEKPITKASEIYIVPEEK